MVGLGWQWRIYVSHPYLLSKSAFWLVTVLIIDLYQYLLEVGFSTVCCIISFILICQVPWPLVSRQTGKKRKKQMDTETKYHFEMTVWSERHPESNADARNRINWSLQQTRELDLCRFIRAFSTGSSNLLLVYLCLLGICAWTSVHKISLLIS